MGRIRVYPHEDTATDVPWSAASYPHPEPDFAPDPFREMAPTTERLFWKDKRSLAYRAGVDHPVDEEPLLMTWEELNAPPPPPPPPKRGPGRPRKHFRDDGSPLNPPRPE